MKIKRNTEMFTRYLENQISLLQEEVCLLDMRTDENIKLNNNWNELKEYIEKQIIDSKTTSSENYYFKTIYKFMLELEGKSE